MGLNDNEKIKEYLSSICCQIRNSKIHSDIQEEVRGHIEEIAQEYIDGGLSENEAINNALTQMGDASLIGRELNKVHKQKPEWSIIILTSIFAVLGLSMIFLIDYSGILNYSLFSKSIIGTLIGLSFAAFLYYFDYMKIKSYSQYIYLATIAVMLLTIIFGRTVNGKTFLFIGIGINFIDVSPWLLTISLAGIFSKFNWSENRKSIYGSIIIVVPILLMIVSHSFSALLPYCTSVIVLLIMSGVKIKKISILITSCLTAFILFLFKEPYRTQRLLIFLNAKGDPQGSGYLNIQLDKLIHSAGIWGQGLTFDGKMLPEIHTDFIFTYIIYTFGWIAGILLVVLIVLFLVRIGNIALYVKNSYGKLLISGFTAMFSVQFVWNILMNLSLAPITSVDLPFISYGNSQFIISMAVVGLISNIYKQKNKTLWTA
ncbi:FtsW/RodA/SpoVE family cell cycle protein [Clostridium lacusfryxellense]|uniref:FtsW/RodA/SpoVE family cell cycle protein n=1 Tax=Clostridium lacusfryxellense TaxID=205328 RepID=UPI001C0B56A0|nr:FtsW/RodA/SpoVE family cell cycle protein [Clostridium lacusfryxellense]MBU3111948.1 FtsW/RodA/SpoVE family cell cycle protein [Clostridium lacusfryxellense]